MKLITAAFSSSTPLCARRSILLSNRCLTRRQRTNTFRSNNTPRMLSPASVVSELLAGTILGFGTYYLVFREQPTQETTHEKKQPSSSRGGIIGLSYPEGSMSRSTTASTLTAPRPSTSPLFDTVGVDINDYLDSGDGPLQDKQHRLEEELTFAASALSDLSGCDATLVIDTAGDVVWVVGDLVSDTTELGRLPSQVRVSRQPESLNVTDNSRFPFLTDEVRNVAVLPIGEQGAVLVIASRQKDFFGVMEKRVANAVCGRLARFLYVPPALEA